MVVWRAPLGQTERVGSVLKGGLGGEGPPADRPPTVPVVDDQVDGHLALEAADVAMAEVVAQLVNLGHSVKHKLVNLEFI